MKFHPITGKPIAQIRRSGVILALAGSALLYGAVVGLGMLYSSMAHAGTPSGRLATQAHAADIASSGAALAFVEGAAEANPIGWGFVPVGYLAAKYHENKPCAERDEFNSAMTGVKSGLAVSNLMLLVPVLREVHFFGMLAAAPMAKYADGQEHCTLTDAQILALATWRKAYIEGDADLLAEVARADVVEPYRAFFARTASRDVVYTDIEQSPAGIRMRFRATKTYPDGRTVTNRGDMVLVMDGGRVVGAGQHTDGRKWTAEPEKGPV